MSGTTNAVFRPDVTDYGMPPQNRLAPQPTWADAATYNAQAVGDYIAQQRAKSEQMGLWDPNTGLPTGAGVVNAAQQYGSGMLMGTTAPGIRAFHGSPHDFERFDTSKIGTGQGVQSYGHGLYFAEGEGVARSYRDQLAPQNIPNPEFLAAQHEYNAKYDAVGRATSGTDEEFNAAIAARDAARERLRGLPAVVPNPAAGGSMYEVNIGADPEQFLHWDKPIKDQPDIYPKIEAMVAPDQLQTFRFNAERGITGGNAYYNYIGGDAADASAKLHQAGIPGIRYLDQGSRGAGQGTHNYVVFDANTIDILRKYGLAGLGIGLGATAAGTQQQSQ